MIATYGALLLLATGAEGEQKTVDVSAGLQVRPRLEKSFTGGIGVNATGPGGDDLADYRTTQRTRAFVTAKGDGVMGKVSVQDVRQWGTEGGTLSDAQADAVDFHEAFVELGSGALKLKVGRQEYILDEHRLIGNVDWVQQGRSFDALRLDYKHESGFGLTAFWSRVQDFGNHDLIVLNPTYGTEAYKLSIPVIVESNMGVNGNERTSLSTSGPSSYFSGADDDTRFTGGIHVSGTAMEKALMWRGEFYYQGGSTKEGDGEVKLGAMMGGLAVDYKVNDMVTPGLIIDYVSGDDGSDAEQAKGFNTLYATNHKWYGYMDRFVSFSERGRGLIDIAPRAKIKAGPGSLEVAVHYFQFAAGPDGASNAAGIEPDVIYTMPIVEKIVNFQAGVGVFMHQGDIADAIDNKTEDWVYAQLDINI